MTSSPQPLPSLPPSPNTEHAPLPAPIPLATRKHEEDIAQAWHEDEPTITDVEHLNPHARKKSRKGKERAGSESDEDDEDEESAAAAGYPPTKEEEAESRRVEEVRTLSTLASGLICRCALASPIAPRHASSLCALPASRSLCAPRLAVNLCCFPVLRSVFLSVECARRAHCGPGMPRLTVNL